MSFLAIGGSFGFSTSALVFFPFDFVDFLYPAVKLICYLCGSVVPQFIILHLYPDWPEAKPEALQKEVQHVGAAGQIVKVHVEVFVEVYAHAIWISVVFWSDLVAQLEVKVRLMMRESQLWDPHLDL